MRARGLAKQDLRRTRRGRVSKTGNQNIRFVLWQAAWAYRFQPAVKEAFRKHQEGLDSQAIHVSMKAQQRLRLKYRKLLHCGKHNTVAVTAVARELIGFIWAIACHVGGQHIANGSVKDFWYRRRSHKTDCRTEDRSNHSRESEHSRSGGEPWSLLCTQPMRAAGAVLS